MTLSVISSIALSENKVFVTGYLQTYNKSECVGLLYNIQEDTIYLKTTRYFNAIRNVSYTTSTLINNKIILLHNKYMSIFTIYGDTVVEGPTIEIIEDTNTPKIAIFLSEDKALVLYNIGGTNNKLGGRICTNLKDKIKKIESKDDIIAGIAKTSGTEGQTIQVALPDIEAENQ